MVLATAPPRRVGAAAFCLLYTAMYDEKACEGGAQRTEGQEAARAAPSTWRCGEGRHYAVVKQGKVPCKCRGSSPSTGVTWENGYMYVQKEMCAKYTAFAGARS